MKITTSLRAVAVLAGTALATSTLAVPAAAAPTSWPTATRIVDLLSSKGVIGPLSATDPDERLYQGLMALGDRECTSPSVPAETDLIMMDSIQVAGARALLLAYDVYTDDEALDRVCTFAVLAPDENRFDGSVKVRVVSTLDPAQTLTNRLGADYTITDKVFTNFDVYPEVTLTASGQLLRTEIRQERKVLSTPKSAKEKKVAKKAYDKRIKAAKKAYKKAVAKAGRSKSKKSKVAQAKRTLKQETMRAKRAYTRAARVPHQRVVHQPKAFVVATPFSLGVNLTEENDVLH